MKPIVAKGHGRPITQAKYNREGDLFFTTGRDKEICVWYSDTGERLGTYTAPGAVLSVDVTADTQVIVTGSAPDRLNVWDVKSGTALFDLNTKSSARHVEFSPDNSQLLTVMEAQLGQPAAIFVFDFDYSNRNDIKLTQIKTILCVGSTFVKASWSYDSKYIVACQQDGYLKKINVASGESEISVKAHSESIRDLQMNVDRTYFVTSSRDKTSKLFYVDDLSLQKTFIADVPLNTAAITPVKDFIICGGGIDAKEVTTTANGKFETHFFHKIFGDDLARLPGHFGPILTVAVHPLGTSFVSASEDGYIRIHHFDKSYLDYEHQDDDDEE